MKTFRMIGLALMATLTGASFSACTSETEEVLGQDTEIRLTSEITPPSRGTDLTQQATQIVAGQQVGVTITGAKAGHDNIAWTAGADGALTNTGEALFYGSGAATITAYHPYKSAWTGVNSKVPADVETDQSGEGYLRSDLLWATASASKTAEAVPLTFTHKLSKINVTLQSTDTNLSGANIYINGVILVTYFNPVTGEITPHENTIKYLIKAGTTTADKPTSTAIIVPQTVAAGTKFIKVELNGNTYNYTLPAEKTFESGHSYSYTLNLTKGLEVNLVSDNITPWEDTLIEETIENEEVKFRNVTIAGTLSTLINETDKYSITALKVNGNLNGTDIRVLREMAGRNHENDATNGKLIYLDLSEANIVSGGDAYYSSITTEANTMGDVMFQGCNLQNIILPESVTTLKNGVFVGNPITSITIPVNVSEIGDAFAYMPKLYEISVDADNQKYIVEDGCLFRKDKTELICFPPAKYAKTYSVPNSVTTIRANAFNLANIEEIIIPDNIRTIDRYTFSQSSRLKSVTLPNSITQIEFRAFEDCINLTSITLPNNIAQIGDYAFYRCSSLTSITFPKSITTIGNYVFWVCSKLKEVHCLSTMPPTAGASCFYSISKDAVLYVPTGSKAAYETADIWKDFATIVEE